MGRDEDGKPDAWWANRLEANTVFGGWIGSSSLLGVAGVRVHGAVKLRHKGMLWGMYVRPEARGTGLAASLVQRVIEEAQSFVEEICLTVVASNAAAHRLYRAAGFEQYGLERRALRVGEQRVPPPHRLEKLASCIFGSATQQRQKPVDQLASGDAIDMGAHIDGRDDRVIITAHRD
jgi:GNAT superfamily N-acetyltransferase